VPIVSPGRVVGVDVARYFALVGMIATHALVASTPDGGATTVQQIAGGRASALFAVLAGVSMALMSGGRTPVTGRARSGVAAGLAVRALIVFGIGLFLGSLETTIAIILSYYGVLFLLGIPFLGLRARGLALLALAWAVLSPLVSHVVRPDLPPRTLDSPHPATLMDQPFVLLTELLFTGYYPAFPWLTYLLAGMAVGRCDLRRVGTAVWLIAIGGVAAVGSRLLSDRLVDDPVVLEALQRTLDEVPHEAGGLADSLEHGLHGSTPTGSGWWLVTSAPHSATPFDLVHTTGSALVVIGLCLLVTRIFPTVWAVVFGAGTMTLSLYTLHVILRTPLFFPDDNPETFWLHVVIVTVIGAGFRLAGRSGPLERIIASAAGAVRRSVAAGPSGRATSGRR
jgi:uncharacterized membrane protein